MKTAACFIVGGIAFVGGLLSADGESFLKLGIFPKTIVDVPFQERMEVLEEGYMPYESVYDENGVCLENCAYSGITFEQFLKDIESAEQESQGILSTCENTNNTTTSQPYTTQGAVTTSSSQTQNSNSQSSSEQTTTRNCTDFMENIPVTQNIPIGEPFKQIYSISSGFNPHRMHPIEHVIKPHNGTDISAPFGTKIYTVANGTVISVWSDNSCGKGIIIQHDDTRYRTGYCHLSKQLVKKGDRVSAGCVIGEVGKTGSATGPHLHYIVYVLSNGNYVPVNAENGYIKPSSERH